jgi:hypothetical protein
MSFNEKLLTALPAIVGGYLADYLPHGTTGGRA